MVCIWMHYLSISTAVFPGEPGLASSIEAKDDGSGSDNWSLRRANQSNRH